MNTTYYVKITRLKQNITREHLATKFTDYQDWIYLPADQTGPNYYAKVNGFVDEEAALQFVQRWDNTRIFTATIKCKLVATQSNNTQSGSPDRSHQRDCRNGSRCYNDKCALGHPDGWEACRDGADCDAYFCKANHPAGWSKPCPDGHHCTRGQRCFFLHPLPDMFECPDGVECRRWGCSAWHPSKRTKECKDGQECYTYLCPLVHPPQRQVCSSGVDCTDVSCQLTHPPTRPARCDQDVTCGNFYCELLHPIEWDPCENGVKCTDARCLHFSHPADRVVSSDDDTSGRQSPPSRLKSIEQRKIERKRAALPIFAAEQEFCQRLKNERLLVVTAETGSGKSTQLPQYAAEYFGGLVVCTQPRVIAAISLARRVANEYDGVGVGRSVGYHVGVTGTGKGHNRVPGTDILFMTDGALVQESIEDGSLSHVRVLIIDEAHERSLSTDMIMGMAKLLLKTRKKDFYVVISSATIDAKKFLDFFKQSDSQLLRVPGRIYPVSVENIPQTQEKIEEHAVSTLLNLYNKHEGTTLVFLPGQREIDQAIELFERSKPENCLALPLYSVLSTEEQDRVLQFHEGPNKEFRLVVFCTNIAETSLTIANTRLIIDSGLARETRFDSELRLTEMKTMRISRASADQRKGRAGRTAPGHCVRLYEQKELIREDTEPAILRSSLDLVVLQLVNLQRNPLEFPFVDSPDANILERSLEVLKDLSCIDDDHQITDRGALIVRLNFDPRYSAFLVDTYLEHEPILELVTSIVAILNASNSLFLIGSSDEDKKLIHTRIIDGARGYDSDLLYYNFVYHRWLSMGVLDPATKKCRTCTKVCNVGAVCRPCRAAHSTTYMLNNRILNTVEALYNAALGMLKDPRWLLKPSLVSDANESDIIGGKLFKYFPQQHARLLEGRSKGLKACMVVNNLPVSINNESALSLRSHDNPHFIAMSMRRLPDGRCLVEKLHPIHAPADLLAPTEQAKSDGMKWNQREREREQATTSVYYTLFHTFCRSSLKIFACRMSML